MELFRSESYKVQTALKSAGTAADVSKWLPRLQQREHAVGEVGFISCNIVFYADSSLVSLMLGRRVPMVR